RWPGGEAATRWRHATASGLPGLPSLAVGRGWVLAGERDGAARLLRTADGQPEATVAGPGGSVRCVALGPGEDLAALGTQQGILRLVRVPSGETVLDLADQTGGVEAVAFSPDGALLAAGSHDGVV